MGLDSFFRPQSVAVIGASRNPRKPGHVIFRNFVENGYRGKVFAVNKNADQILGKRCYASVAAVKEPVELAVIAIAAAGVPQALEACGKAGVKAAIVVSGGFREVGNNGLEDKVVGVARKHGIRLVGPNCLGIFDAHSKVDTLFNPRYKLERPVEGGISFISQSGAVMSVVLDWMSMKGYRGGKFISYGNAADVNEADLLRYLADDQHTKVVCMYIEGVADGRRFFTVAKEAARKKPVVVLKGGITAAGSRAVSSHTGSLAGAAEVYKAAFRQAGVIEAEDIEQLFDFARVLTTQPQPKGRRVQIITDGGGFGILTADWLARLGMEPAVMSKAGLARIRMVSPAHVVTGSVIDLTGDADVERYSAAIDAALDDAGVDILVIIALFQLPALTSDIVEVVAEANRLRKKPIIFIAAGGRFTEVLKKSLENEGVPTFSYPERAAEAAKALYRYRHGG
ncbi:MAG: CoA-binding protein [Candidatus Aenigmarchaeota archaeon]|nr:CoA-binding protein [Candidatus Aenigmarchaeota archaeon]